MIEAAIENIDVKHEVFAALDAACGPNAIFASNTSSLSITEMAATTKRPARFVGLHFFNPVPLMKLVEVVRAPMTDAAVLAEVDAFAKRAGQGRRRGAGHARLRRQPPARAVPARRDPRARVRASPRREDIDTA